MQSEVLQNVGLSQNESAVYLALIHNGKMTVANLSKKSKVKRSTVYLALGALGEKGLVKQAVIGKRHYFMPESPEVIGKIIDQYKKTLDAQLPGLIEVFKKSTKEPELASYYGKDGVKKIYTEVQETALWAKSIFSPASFYRVFSQNESYEFSSAFKRREAKLTSLLPDDFESRKLARDLKERGAGFGTRFLPKDYDLSVNTIVWGNKVALISYENLFGLVISNQEIAKSFENQFDFFWALT